MLWVPVVSYQKSFRTKMKVVSYQLSKSRFVPKKSIRTNWYETTRNQFVPKSKVGTKRPILMNPFAPK